MKAVASLCVLLGAWAAIGIAQESVKRSGEEGRIIALESAWDQAEQNKDATALANLLADNLVYVDYDGSLNNKQQFLASIKSARVSSEQINNEGVTVRLYNNNNVAVSTGIYRDRGVENGKPFQRRGRFTNVWINQNGAWQCIASQSTLITH
jgi:ketosteroid isomerase-like protein